MVRASALIAGLLILAGCDTRPQEAPGVRAARACDEQFGAGSPSSADCQLKIALKAEAKAYGDKQREAERSAGQ